MGTRFRHPWSLVCAGLLAMVCHPPAEAQVLVSITVDGDMSDWSAVLADPAQTSFDGPSAAAPPDRDAPVQSTGRDLTTFAWTWDASYFFMYVRRAGSTSNVQNFIYYIDTDENGLMQAGEPVLHVAWWGNNRRTEVNQYTYVPASPGGDPLGDPAGYADGWTMPGTVSFVQHLETTRGGSNDGLEMETRIAWSVMGVPPGTPMKYHVSASNSLNIPHQIDDNMGGPGGLVGSTRFAGVSLEPDRSGSIQPGGGSVLAHTLTNTGQTADTFNLTWTSTGDFAPAAVVYHLDADLDGLLGPGDPPLTDTDGDGAPDSGPIAAGASLQVLAVVTAPAGAGGGDAATVTHTASSSGSPATSDPAVDTLTVVVPEITLLKSADRADAAPGETLTYTVTYTSTGPLDAFNVLLVDAIPPQTAYLPGSATGGGTLIEYSHDGGASFDGSETAPVTHIRWTILAPLAPGGSGSVTFQATVR